MARKARASLRDEAKAKAKCKAKVEDAEALTGQEQGQEPGQVRAKPQPYAGGDQS